MREVLTTLLALSLYIIDSTTLEATTALRGAIFAGEPWRHQKVEDCASIEKKEGRVSADMANRLKMLELYLIAYSLECELCKGGE
jgi:hypothetical protein